MYTYRYQSKAKRKRRRIRPICKLLAAIVAVAILCIVAINIFRNNSAATSPTESSGASESSSTLSIVSSSTSVTSSSNIAKPSSSLPQSSTVSSSDTVSNANKSDFEYFSDAVFMGDSVTDDIINYDEMEKATVVASIGVSAYKALADHKVAINGNKSDIAWMPDRVAAAKPKKIYMMFGTNDLTWGSQMTTEYFIKNYGKLIDELQSRCPGAKIYVQSILPITAAAENKKNWPFDNAKIDTFNAALKVMCGKKGTKYLNVASVIKGPDGKLPSNVTDDGLHLHSKEYKKWFNYLVSNE